VRTFHLNRVVDETGVSGTGRVAQGVVFDDGTCVLRWLTATPGTTVFASLEALTAVHGHDGKTQVVYDDLGQQKAARLSRQDGLVSKRSPPRGEERHTPIAKLDKAKQIVYGVVLDPYIVDAHDDWVPPNEVEQTAHNYLASHRLIRRQHDSDLAAYPVESWVMPYPTPEDYQKAVALQPHRIWRLKLGSEYVHSGSWVLGTRILDPAVWQDVLSGELGAYSIGGFGVRREIGKVPMPQVEVLTIEAPP